VKQPPLFPWQRAWRGAAAIVIVGILAFLAWLPKNSSAGLPGSACLFHEATGLPCALCGGTRAAKALVHGDFQRALHLNAAAFPAVAGLSLAALIFLWESLRGRALTNWSALARRYRMAFPIGLILLILWWIPQMIGALDGSKSELINLQNPIARTLATLFDHQGR
jgi:hypothetical protein